MTLLQVNFREAFRSLWGSRQRSLLALIGIVIGIGSVIGMVSIGTIVQQEAIRQFKDMGIDIITIRKSFSENKKTEFSMDIILRITEEKRNILAVAPYLASGTEINRGRQKFNMEQMGVTANFFDLNKLQIRQGRAVSELDQNRYFCVVGDELADFLRKTGTARILGSQITAEGRAYTVIGILDKVAEGGLRPYGMNRAMMIPISTALRTFQSPEINTVMARIAPHVSITQIKAEISDYFRKKARGMQVEVTSAEELIDRMKKQMQMFSLLLGAIGSISLIVGGIGVMNVMLISVSERKSEIGLRRALGAQQSDIQSQFLIESVILCLAGGFIGIILGIGISYLFALFSKWQFIMSYSSIALGFGVSTAVGVFCGFYPARSAARLDPIKALRS
ncbi:MAG TPA: macrolide export ATP-binding/permease MacB [Syntrophus sp. (in: bacteria)]|nr:macrolide export ATP-binding/permease MacB [Syntrophus sp. (in: bacteria)]